MLETAEKAAILMPGLVWRCEVEKVEDLGRSVFTEVAVS